MGWGETTECGAVALLARECEALGRASLWGSKMINDGSGEHSTERPSKKTVFKVAFALLLAPLSTVALADGPPCGSPGACPTNDPEGKKALNAIYINPLTTKEQRDRIDADSSGAQRGFTTWDKVYGDPAEPMCKGSPEQNMVLRS